MGSFNKVGTTSLGVFGKSFAISATRTFFVSFQEFSLLLLHGVFLNIVLHKLRFFKSSITPSDFTIFIS